MKLFFLGQLAVSYAGLADFFSDISYVAEDMMLADLSKNAAERWHEDKCQEYLLPDIKGGYWECKGVKKCQLKCHNAGGTHGSVKCKNSTWKGGKGASCPTSPGHGKCNDANKPPVKHGHWDCFKNNGKEQCDLICDEEDIHGAPVTPGGRPVTITCKNGSWWCNDVIPQCPAPNNHCHPNKLRKVENGNWKCDKKNDHCDLHCPSGKQACAATCNRKKCQWEYAGEPKCKDPCTKKKKERCMETCGKEHPYCCSPTRECICKKYPESKECTPLCADCPFPGDNSGRFDCKVVQVKGQTKCDKKKKNCKTEITQWRRVCLFECRGQPTGKKLVCNDEKWWGTHPSDEFTCNPQCKGKLSDIANGHWECKDRSEGGITIPEADCTLVCDKGYQPKKDPSYAKCEDGKYEHNCQARCIKTCESMGMSPCHTGESRCCKRPIDVCEKHKKPKVDGAWWECMIDENHQETCLLKCLNGIIPTNKHGYHVSIKCEHRRWWANDPCISDLCKGPEPTCPYGSLPDIDNGEWQCDEVGVDGEKPVGTECHLKCDHDTSVGKHVYVCKPNGDWFKKYGYGKCTCGGCNPKKECCEGDTHENNPNCEECPVPCDPSEYNACEKNDLPDIHGNGRWHCAVIDTKDGKRFACVVMCGKNKTKQIMTCMGNKKGKCAWRGNINGPCKCDDECDTSELNTVKNGKWICVDNPKGKDCTLKCNGAVKTSCDAICDASKGANWKYDTKITKNHCSGVDTPHDDPCGGPGGCLKCNDYDTPNIKNGKWDCKKKHCDLKCNDGYKAKDGKCSLKCTDHKWVVQGNPVCVPTKPIVDPPIKCKKFVQVKNGWMECLDKSGKGSAYCMLMCNKGHRPEYCDDKHDATANYDCKTGYFSPPGPKGKKSNWGCVKGSCDIKRYDNICWDHPHNKNSDRPGWL